MNYASEAITLLFVMLFCPLAGYAADKSYGDALGKAVIAAAITAKEQKYWKPVAYPTDNFGIATLYDGKGGPDNFLCATSTCLGLSDNKTETLTKAGYISSGKGGSVDLDDTQKRSLALNAVFKLFSIIGLSGKYDSKQTTVVDVTIPSATIRYLIKGQLGQHITSSPATPAVADAWAHYRIRAIVADIEVESLDATVKLDASVDANVKTTLDNNVGRVLAKDGSLTVDYSKSGQGTYKIKTANPVIVAVEPANQPNTGTLETKSGDESWVPNMAIKLKTDSQ